MGKAKKAKPDGAVQRFIFAHPWASLGLAVLATALAFYYVVASGKEDETQEEEEEEASWSDERDFAQQSPSFFFKQLINGCISRMYVCSVQYSSILKWM